MLLQEQAPHLTVNDGRKVRVLVLMGKPDGSPLHRRINRWTFRDYSDAMGQKYRMDILRKRYEAKLRNRLPAGRPLVLFSDLDHGLFMICEVSHEDEARNRSASS